MLKKTAIFAALFCAVYLPMKSQTDKFLIGGQMGFSYSSENPVSSPDIVTVSKNKTVTFSGAPVVGYFINGNIMVGMGFEFSLENIKQEDGMYKSIKTKSFTLNPLARFYFNSPLFTEIRFTWGISNTESDFNQDDNIPFPVLDFKYKSKTLGGGAGIGYDIKLAEKVSLEPLIYYRWNTYKTDELDTKSNQSHLFINLGLVFKI